MKKITVIFLLLLLIPSKFIFPQSEKEIGYRINPKDILEISVYEEPDLSKTLIVGYEGTIIYPLLGNIVAKGFTAKELETKITELLARDYLVSPQVTVLVKESAKISVLGKVIKPGSYELKSSMTIMDAIVNTGGLNSDADGRQVKIVRIKGENKETINVDVNSIIEKGGKQFNIPLEPGDLVIVGGFSQANSQVALFGEVKKPGMYNYTTGMTIIEAIALAGGLTDVAAANSTKIIREKDGKRTVIRIPLDSILKGSNSAQNIDLEPNDAIIVPQSFF